MTDNKMLVLTEYREDNREFTHISLSKVPIRHLLKLTLTPVVFYGDEKEYNLSDRLFLVNGEPRIAPFDIGKWSIKKYRVGLSSKDKTELLVINDEHTVGEFKKYYETYYETYEVDSHTYKIPAIRERK